MSKAFGYSFEGAWRNVVSVVQAGNPEVFRQPGSGLQNVLDEIRRLQNLAARPTKLLDTEFAAVANKASDTDVAEMLRDAAKLVEGLAAVLASRGYAVRVATHLRYKTIDVVDSPLSVSITRAQAI